MGENGADGSKDVGVWGWQERRVESQGIPLLWDPLISFCRAQLVKVVWQ